MVSLSKKKKWTPRSSDVPIVMRIRWTAAAAADLEQIKDYLKERYPSFAQPTVLRLYQGVRSLKRTPYRGR